MTQKIAFKPHKTKGNEIIKILENMGGVNIANLEGNIDEFIDDKDQCYCIVDNEIIYVPTYFAKVMNYKIYTLEEWEEKRNITKNPKEKMVNLDKVCEWIIENMSNYVTARQTDKKTVTVNINNEDMVRDLRNIMK